MFARSQAQLRFSVREILTAAKAKYKSGMAAEQEVLAAEAPLHRLDTLQRQKGRARAKDSAFEKHPANRIKTVNSQKHVVDLPFIAAGGPQEEKQVDNLLFSYFSFNALHQPRITHIVSIGSKIAIEPSPPYDFVNYALGKPGDKKVYTDYTVEYGQSDGELGEAKETFHPEKIIHSVLKVSPNREPNVNQEIAVTTIPLKDMETLKTDPETLKELYKLYQASQLGTLLIHCSSGTGRTGHLIFTLQIVREYRNIFVGSAEETAERLIQLLNNLRTQSGKPGMVWTEAQFEGSIRCAIELYKYILQEKLHPQDEQKQEADSDEEDQPLVHAEDNARSGWRKFLCC